MSNLYLTLDNAVETVKKMCDSSSVEQIEQMLYDEFYEACDISLMRGNEYQKLASRTINPEINNTSMQYHALHGMVGEIGEIHSLYQKVYQGHEFDYDHMRKELGDLLWFIAEYCTAMDWKLEDIMQLNIEKLLARFPDGFEVDKSLHRAEGDV